ncbi:TPA: hypothetical protein DCY68_00940 [Candidatus Azambacteria bacterium]|uniref:Type 4 fimbrial biogenesis protein PilX N-terminal domain-containing protein n=2 Tax=Candidatus Azamiibacteriota TaxID=1752741 RepID=A0A1F5C5U7_9BACT|nr:MAG: hypothetical protein A2W60_00940 [Candidatus Azambacteria bacterium RIFCSPHIGHO2_02_46_12]OGD38240.1 MAG: hypothetical protein A3A25_03555 [Candidatus Azambacteria bacterium RIFCSPLOWO2_01_FULL_46_26]HBA52353.1 hypothetical protein [Candidatus Azambacteria bacterium]
MKKGKIFNQHFFSEKGITLLLTVFVLGGILAIAASLATTAVIQLKISGAVEDSTVAFYAADAGIECRLYYIRQGEFGVTDDCMTLTTLNNGASYQIDSLYSTNPMKAVGIYRATRRGIEATY